MLVSAVINTWNEEKNIKRCLNSLVSWIDEVIVVDMNSQDKTREIAQKMGAKVFLHAPEGFVEPARNFAINKASGDWIVILDADEEIPDMLAAKIEALTSSNHNKSFFRIPRKNIIFGKWIKHARWWPDLQIRLFKKGRVTWLNEIHSIPVTEGEGIDFEIKEENAITHYNYSSISQFITRVDRYTTIQAKELIAQNHIFRVTDLFKKPTGEFISRFLAEDGYKDGLHGFAVCILQSFSELILHLKLWENTKFSEEKLDLNIFEAEKNQISGELHYWIKEQKLKQEKNNLKRIVKRVII